VKVVGIKLEECFTTGGLLERRVIFNTMWLERRKKT
jgi:hypothetical protein